MIESIATLAELHELKDRSEGYWILCEEDNKIYALRNGEWEEVNITEDANLTTGEGTSNVNLSLYEMNRQLVAQLPEFEESQWDGAFHVMDDWYKAHPNDYYLIYGREINYFTLLKKSTEGFENLMVAVKECLDNIGPVHAIDPTKDNDAIEIWVDCDGTMTCMYLFGYDDGVVTFNG